MALRTSRIGDVNSVVDFERNAFITWPGGVCGFDGSEIVLLDKLTLTALQGKLVHVQIAILRRYQKSEKRRSLLATGFIFENLPTLTSLT